ncbi:McrB family protein [Natronorubrum thiooxidans]|uniref:5-methylcytosine-specific restriction enzyme B n=1 Tax=Natronorubrum thiooxidans TaxID=308853 RepID=A0A1N7H893_9EURY|nr:AAA family ATPase [Natronorubrum thiooxidans]SIS21079.1 5-methylcytosine-specific restriction enzyme B [Natronorubrum thiooxidans]
MNLLSAELVSEDVKEWSSALSGIEPNVTITTDSLEQCQRLLDLYDHLEDDLEALAEQHRIGSLNRASPPETVFLALGRDLQSRVGSRVNFNQVKWGVLREEAYEVEGAGSIEPPAERPADARMVAQQLEQTGQVVFYGPPGTGKTYTAQQFARWWINEQSEGATRANQLELTTFHPSFSYEDFIEGLTAKEQDGAVEYVVEPGVFKQICKRAERAYRNSDSSDKAPPYVLIIDEINRGNLAQIFGELMTLLEIDKRLDAPNETRSRLAHSNESFVVPPNLYLIGTMNTADESIALLDTALRRRFRFHAFPPNFDVVAEAYGFPAGGPQSVLREGGAPRDQLVAASILALEELNERIRAVNQLGKGKQLGHTYLFGHDRIENVRDTWRFDILPQLEDYYFGKFDRLQSDLFGNVAVGLIDWQSERIAEFTPETLYEELCSIAGIEDYAPLGRPIETDGAAPSSESPPEDSWAAGKKTPETFRKRITENTDEPVRGRLLELYDLGDELGRLDPGPSVFS